MILTEEIIRTAARDAECEALHENVSLEESLCFNDQIQYDLFFSHSFRDKELVIGVKVLFEKAGYKVYIDWMEDPQLDRSCVNENTAQLLKYRLKSCKALAYIATVNTPLSRWCPWELGLADGMLGKVCILPVMHDDYKGQEYLRLYPYLEYAPHSNINTKDFFLYNQNDKEEGILLKSWIDEGQKPHT